MFREKVLLRASLVEEITDPGLHQQRTKTGIDGKGGQCPETVQPQLLGLVLHSTAQERGPDFVV